MPTSIRPISEWQSCYYCDALEAKLPGLGWKHIGNVSGTEAARFVLGLVEVASHMYRVESKDQESVTYYVGENYPG